MRRMVSACPMTAWATASSILNASRRQCSRSFSDAIVVVSMIRAVAPSRRRDSRMRQRNTNDETLLGVYAQGVPTDARLRFGRSSPTNARRRKPACRTTVSWEGLHTVAGLSQWLALRASCIVRIVFTEHSRLKAWHTCSLSGMLWPHTECMTGPWQHTPPLRPTSSPAIPPCRKPHTCKAFPTLSVNPNSPGTRPLPLRAVFLAHRNWPARPARATPARCRRGSRPECRCGRRSSRQPASRMRSPPE